MKNPHTRQRLILAMIDALQRRGLHGSGLTELLAAAQAPKGVLYHHFPGGKSELAVAAVNATVERLRLMLDERMGAADPAAALMAWIGGAQKRLAGSGYEFAARWPRLPSKPPPATLKSAPRWAPVLNSRACASAPRCTRPATPAPMRWQR